MPTEERYSELDALRGIAVCAMVFYHFFFDLAFFFGRRIPLQNIGWHALANATATLFLLLVGACFAISWTRHSLSAPPTQGTRSVLSLYPKYLRRGLLILAGGMVISLATAFITPGMSVKFGILHLIGVATLVLPFFARFLYGNVILGTMISLLTPVLYSLQDLPAVPAALLIPLGLPPPTFASIDYYPLVPWFGVILTGLGLGQLLYLPERHPRLRAFGALPYPPFLLWLGRRSLWIYFAHQPLILILLSLVLGMPAT